MIYRLEDELRSVMESMLPRECKLVSEGTARVKQVFHLSGKSEGTAVAGLIVEQGALRMNPSSSSSSSSNKNNNNQDNNNQRNQNNNNNNNNNNSSSSNNNNIQYIYRISRQGKLMTGADKLIASGLKKYKDSVHVVEQGDECGLTIDKYKDYEVDDTIECLKLEWIKKSLSTTATATATTTATATKR